jgi:hypothetical protein
MCPGASLLASALHPVKDPENIESEDDGNVASRTGNLFVSEPLDTAARASADQVKQGKHSAATSARIDNGAPLTSDSEDTDENETTLEAKQFLGNQIWHKGKLIFDQKTPIGESAFNESGLWEAASNKFKCEVLRQILNRQDRKEHEVKVTISLPRQSWMKIKQLHALRRRVEVGQGNSSSIALETNSMLYVDSSDLLTVWRPENNRPGGAKVYHIFIESYIENYADGLTMTAEVLPRWVALLGRPLMDPANNEFILDDEICRRAKSINVSREEVLDKVLKFDLEKYLPWTLAVSIAVPRGNLNGSSDRNPFEFKVRKGDYIPSAQVLQVPDAKGWSATLSKLMKPGTMEMPLHHLSRIDNLVVQLSKGGSSSLTLEGIASVGLNAFVGAGKAFPA